MKKLKYFFCVWGGGGLNGHAMPARLTHVKRERSIKLKELQQREGRREYKRKKKVVDPLMVVILFYYLLTHL